MNLHIQKNGKNSSKGFYIALGVCLIAIGVAAWTTYDSVMNYASPGGGSASSATEPTNNTVSGVFVSEAPSSSSAAPSSQPSSAPASQAPSSAVSKPATASSKSPAKPANAVPSAYSYPVSSRTIVQKFSEDPVFCQTTQDWRAHPGLDLSANLNLLGASSSNTAGIQNDYPGGAVLLIAIRALFELHR